MSQFRFRLSSVLQYRIHYRDLCRQLLAQVMADLKELELRQRSLEEDRQAVLNQMQVLAEIGTVDVRGAAARRYHAGILTSQLLETQKNKNVVSGQLELVRQALMEADQKVKSLERLEEQKRRDHIIEDEKRASREMEDAWVATNLAEYTK